MKRFLLALGLIVAMSTFVPTQARVNFNINIGVQPAWGPVGYDYAGYYYFPDIDIYYNVNASQFVYWDGGVWVSARYLPYRYRNYDLYPMYKVVINDRDPWRRHNYYHNHYSHYRGHRNQPIIRYSNDRRYRESRNNRVNWVDQNRRPSNGRYSSNDRRHDNNRHDNNRYSNSRSSSNSNRNDRYTSGRSTTSARNSASRDNSVSRPTNTRPTTNSRDQRVSPNRSNNERRQTSASSRVSNTSSRSDRSVASVDRSSRSSSSHSNNTESHSSRSYNNGRTSR